MTGISPPSEDRSRSRTSGESSFSDPELFQPGGRALVPAATTMLRFTGSSPAPQRDTGYSSSSAASPPQRGPELSATQGNIPCKVPRLLMHTTLQMWRWVLRPPRTKQ